MSYAWSRRVQDWIAKWTRSRISQFIDRRFREGSFCLLSFHVDSNPNTRRVERECYPETLHSNPEESCRRRDRTAKDEVMKRNTPSEKNEWVWPSSFVPGRDLSCIREPREKRNGKGIERILREVREKNAGRPERRLKGETWKSGEIRRQFRRFRPHNPLFIST